MGIDSLAQLHGDVEGLMGKIEQLYQYLRITEAQCDHPLRASRLGADTWNTSSLADRLHCCNQCGGVGYYIRGLQDGEHPELY